MSLRQINATQAQQMVRDNVPAEQMVRYAYPAGPIVRHVPEDVNIDLVGERVTSKGTKVIASMAQNAVKSFFTGSPLPIYQDYPGIPMELGYNNLSAKYKPQLLKEDENLPDWNLVLNVTGEKHPVIRPELYEAASSLDITDRPIVMLVTTKMPHAIIYIFHGINLYTCGYGYDDLVGHDFKNITSNLLERKGLSDIAHTFEKMKGAIYSADVMAPLENHEAKISWVGFLDTGMLDRIQEFLNNTLFIIFTGKKEGRYDKVFSYSKLIVSDSYYAAAGILPSRQAYNCLTWAQKILNVSIDCGLRGSPEDCAGITQEQFTEIHDNLNNKNLPKIIEKIQKTIAPAPNICTRIGKAIGICGGSRRKRKGKGKGKKGNKKTNKRRNNK
jgi:hypothetical protein